MSTPDVTTPEGRAELCAKARTLAISLEQGNFARLEAAHMIRELRAAIRAEEAARREALEEAARDVCPYCGRRALGYGPAEGPDEAGHWTHRAEPAEPGDRILLCPASAIYARLRYERVQEKGDAPSTSPSPGT